MTDFQREERYVVIKISKMHPHPAFRIKHLSALKREHGDALVDCVVVEHDWPEYEHVWSMIESRITGAPTLDHVNCHSTIRKQSEQIDRLRAQLAERGALLRHARRLLIEFGWAEGENRFEKEIAQMISAIDGALSASAEQIAPVERDDQQDLRDNLNRMTGLPTVRDAPAKGDRVVIGGVSHQFNGEDWKKIVRGYAAGGLIQGNMGSGVEHAIRSWVCDGDGAWRATKTQQMSGSPSEVDELRSALQFYAEQKHVQTEPRKIPNSIWRSSGYCLCESNPFYIETGALARAALERKS